MDDKRLTPMLSQYRQIKSRFPDALVLFRLGDFYETFEADAKIAARELELVLTSRSFAKGVRLPMAGVPHHHVQAYIAKLIDKGYKVALVEQLEDPKKVKRLVKRDVIRVITPGTVVEDTLLRAHSENYLVAVVRAQRHNPHPNPPPFDKARTREGEFSPSPVGYGSDGGGLGWGSSFGLAILDISTGEFATTQIDGADAETKLLDELQRVLPSEYVLPQSLANDDQFVARLKAIRPARISPVEDRVCDPETARHELIEHLRVTTLEPFGCESLPLAIAAAGAALHYLKSNQPTPTPDPSHPALNPAHALHPAGQAGQAVRKSNEPMRKSPSGGYFPQGSRERGGGSLSRETGEGRVGADYPLAHLNHLWTFSLADYMTLDAATRRNLELITPIHIQVGTGVELPSHQRHTRSLFGVLDHTVTAMGARLLKRWIQQPLLDLNQIHARLDAVEELHQQAFLREDLRKLLDGLYDIERLVGRIGFGNANARDLIGLKRVLVRLPQIKARLAQAHSARLRELEQTLDELQDVAGFIERAVVDDPPIFIKEGGLIKRGYHATLDELREHAAQGKNWLSELEAQEKQRTGIKNLRVRYNEVFGFFIEVPRSAGHLIPKHYERRATITHAERYVTPELKAQEAQILSTEDRVKDLEYDLFVDVRREVARHSARLQTAARILAQVDVLCALAEGAARYNYVKPIVEEGDAIEIREGRHPVVERFLRDGESFVPNDVRLDGESVRVIILTGPNMSGKSVFVRQVALIVLMAQIGSFVPASSARIGLTDRIFTRVGASDDIAQGRSTFLVEMSETSYILRHATPRSLIVLDEVGRGTSTYDGISLAWAIAEEIHNCVGAKTLFATHYHELTQLATALPHPAPSTRATRAPLRGVEGIPLSYKERGDTLPLPAGEGRGEGELNAVKNYTMAVKERGNEVIFLRQVIEGGAEKSFGIHVAQLAGLNPRVIERAKEVLRGLEISRETTEGGKQRADEYALTVDERSVVREENMVYDARLDVWRDILSELAQVDIANITPVQALNLLNEIQMRVKQLSADVDSG